MCSYLSCVNLPAYFKYSLVFLSQINREIPAVLFEKAFTGTRSLFFVATRIALFLVAGSGEGDGQEEGARGRVRAQESAPGGEAIVCGAAP